jgi:hypothetical protein
VARIVVSLDSSERYCVSKVSRSSRTLLSSERTSSSDMPERSRQPASSSLPSSVAVCAGIDLPFGCEDELGSSSDTLAVDAVAVISARAADAGG